MNTATTQAHPTRTVMVRRYVARHARTGRYMRWDWTTMKYTWDAGMAEASAYPTPAHVPAAAPTAAIESYWVSMPWAEALELPTQAQWEIATLDGRKV
jgi:hypothetical protein